MVFCGAFTVQAQRMIFRNVTSEDGLPDLRVSDVTQDPYGFIWIGAWEGVYRFDGKKYKKVINLDARHLQADGEGVWMSAGGGHLHHYKFEDDSLYAYDINTDRYAEIATGPNGEVYVGTRNGLMLFDPERQAFRSIPETENMAMFFLRTYHSGKVSFVVRPPNIDEHPTQVGVLHETGDLEFHEIPPDPTAASATDWLSDFFLMDSALLILNEFGWATKKLGSDNWVFRRPSNTTESIAGYQGVFDHQGYLWIHSDQQLMRIDLSAAKVSFFKHDPSDASTPLPANEQFFGARMMIDRQGIMWLPRFAYGLTTLDFYQNDFGLMTHADGEVIREPISILEQEDGTLWLGTRNVEYGLLRIGRERRMFKSYTIGIGESSKTPPGRTPSSTVSHPFSWALVAQNDGTIWSGTGHKNAGSGGLNRIGSDDSGVVIFKHDPEDTASIPFNTAIRISTDSRGSLWVSPGFGKIFKFDPETERVDRNPLRNIDRQEYLPDLQQVHLILRDDRLIVACTSQVILSVNTEDMSVEEIDFGPIEKERLMIHHEDETGKVWFLCDQGFGSLDNELKSWDFFFNYDTADFDWKVKAINSDSEGRIWLATDQGIVRYHPNDKTFFHYSSDRGLQSGSFYHWINHKGPSGKIYFGGPAGLNVFDPSNLSGNPYPPAVIFNQLSFDDEVISLTTDYSSPKETFIVGPYKRSITFEFSAIHYADPGSNRFEYRLDGFDKDWRSGGTIGMATYTNLDPGSYRFLVRARNWDGVWSDGDDSLTIIVLPPWWMTWWAYVIYFIMILTGGYGLYRVQRAITIRIERDKIKDERLAQAKEVEKAYQELKTTQTQLIHSEKMASLGELTAGIAHEIQNPLNFVNNFSDVNKDLAEEMIEEMKKGNLAEAEAIANDLITNETKITHHGKRAEEIVKSMLLHSRGSDGEKQLTNINELADEYIRLAYHGLRAKDPSFNAEIKTDFDSSLPNVSIVPQDIGRVLLNLLNNAFSAVSEVEGPTVNLKTQKLNNSITITISDNGPGIPPDIRDKIFQPFFTTKPTGSGTGLGLSLSYDIVKAHGGELSCVAGNGLGALFSFQIPIAAKEDET